MIMTPSSFYLCPSVSWISRTMNCFWLFFILFLFSFISSNLSLVRLPRVSAPIIRPLRTWPARPRPVLEVRTFCHSYRSLKHRLRSDLCYTLLTLCFAFHFKYMPIWWLVAHSGQTSYCLFRSVYLPASVHNYSCPHKHMLEYLFISHY